MPASNTSRKGRYNGCDDLEGISGRGVGRLLAGDDIELDPSEGDLTESDVTISALPPDWDDITNKPTIPTVNKITAGDKITLDPTDGDLTKGDVKISAIVDSAPTINKLTAGPAITLNPADGDLTKGDVKISASSNTNPGVAVIYEPIYVDLQSDYNEKGWIKDASSPDDHYWMWDYFGSEGLKDAANMNPFSFIMEESPFVPIPNFPAEANGFFLEVFWKTCHVTSPRYMQLHPGYGLDCTVETWQHCKNISYIEGAQFVSGEETEMHDDASAMITTKLSAVSTQYDVNQSVSRQSKMNFATTTAGTEVKIAAKIRLMKYHYSAMWASLGRFKIIPVKMSDTALAVKFIKPMIENDVNPTIIEGQLDAKGSNYKMVESDAVRMNGDDVRQAVEALNSSIDFAIATGGDAGSLNALRTRLQAEVLNGSGGFEAIRAKLTEIKEQAAALGVLKLAKFETDAGCVWNQPGNMPE